MSFNEKLRFSSFPFCTMQASRNSRQRIQFLAITLPLKKEQFTEKHQFIFLKLDLQTISNIQHNVSWLHRVARSTTEQFSKLISVYVLCIEQIGDKKLVFPLTI